MNSFTTRSFKIIIAFKVKSNSYNIFYFLNMPLNIPLKIVFIKIIKTTSLKIKFKICNV